MRDEYLLNAKSRQNDLRLFWIYPACQTQISIVSSFVGYWSCPVAAREICLPQSFVNRQTFSEQFATLGKLSRQNCRGKIVAATLSL
jgi:hypothetical protein